MEKVDYMQKQMGNGSRYMKSQRRNQKEMLQIEKKNKPRILWEMKNGLIRRLNKHGQENNQGA